MEVVPLGRPDVPILVVESDLQLAGRADEPGHPTTRLAPGATAAVVVDTLRRALG